MTSKLRVNEIEMLDGIGKTYPTFDSVQEMKTSNTLSVGQKVRTLGYYAPGDGGGNEYEIVAAGTGTDDGGSFIDLTGSGLQAKGYFGGVINVKKFGARADYLFSSQSGTDDTTAINNAFQLIRDAARAVGHDLINRMLIVPPGNYYVTSINFTDVKVTAAGTPQGRVKIMGYGARFISGASGKIVVDMTNTLGVALAGPTVIGLDSSPPRIGIQLARGQSRISSDRNFIDDVVVSGSFTLASFYNYASERFHCSDSQFNNNYNDPNAYAYLLDGRNRFDVQSDYWSYIGDVEVGDSNLSHYFEQCTFAKAAGSTGEPIYLYHFGRLTMENCYAISTDSYGVRISSSNREISDLNLNLHVETGGSLGSIVFEAQDTSLPVNIRKFRHIENDSHGSLAIYYAEPGVEVNIYNVDILVGRYLTEPSAGFTEPNDQFNFYGGDVTVPSGADMPKGSFGVTYINDDSTYHKGGVKFYASNTQRPSKGQLTQRDLVEINNGKLSLGSDSTSKQILAVTDAAGNVQKWTMIAMDSGSRLQFYRDINGSNIQSFGLKSSGTIILPRLPSDPDPSESIGGEMYFNSSNNTFRRYRGSSIGWEEF